MKSIWMSIRSAISFLLVGSLCLFIGVFTWTGKIEGAAGLKVLETLAVISMTFYFTLKTRNGNTPEPPEANIYRTETEVSGKPSDRIK